MAGNLDEHEQRAPDDEPAASSWSPDHPLGDPDAWRGGGGDDADVWRGALHPTGWPEWDAGPEYRMWKRIAVGER